MIQKPRIAKNIGPRIPNPIPKAKSLKKQHIHYLITKYTPNVCKVRNITNYLSGPALSCCAEMKIIRLRVALCYFNMPIKAPSAKIVTFIFVKLKVMSHHKHLFGVIGLFVPHQTFSLILNTRFRFFRFTWLT